MRSKDAALLAIVGRSLKAMDQTLSAMQSKIASPLTPEQEKELEIAKKRNHHGTNPFVYESRMASSTPFSIGFTVPRKQEPLWWTGSGFKDLARMPSVNAEDFATHEEAERKIKAEVLKEIRRYRDDDAHLIFGWGGL